MMTIAEQIERHAQVVGWTALGWTPERRGDVIALSIPDDQSAELGCPSDREMVVGRVAEGKVIWR